MSVYEVVLMAHSLWRWVVIVAFVVVIVRAVRGWAKARPWIARDERLHALLVAAADFQLVLGLLLYTTISPISAAFLANPRMGIQDPTLRFFGLEHLTTMLAAIVTVHAGRTLSKRVALGPLRHRRVFAWTLAALLLVVVGIPWPGLKYGRPLVRPLSSLATRSAGGVDFAE